MFDSFSLGQTRLGGCAVKVMVVCACQMNEPSCFPYPFERQSCTKTSYASILEIMMYWHLRYISVWVCVTLGRNSGNEKMGKHHSFMQNARKCLRANVFYVYAFEEIVFANIDILQLFITHKCWHKKVKKSVVLTRKSNIENFCAWVWRRTLLFRRINCVCVHVCA